MAAHVCLKKELVEDEKCHNLMSWLICAFVIHMLHKKVLSLLGIVYSILVKISLVETYLLLISSKRSS